jgi:hypothetical protein
MRALDALAVAAALSVVGLAGMRLAQMSGVPPTPPAVAGTAAGPAAAPAEEPLRAGWPALFGQPEAVAAAPASVAARPPLAATLKGLASIGATRWALVGHDGADRLLREGDSLAPGLVVARIHAGGVDLEGAGGRQTLRFAGGAGGVGRGAAPRAARADRRAAAGDPRHRRIPPSGALTHRPAPPERENPCPEAGRDDRLVTGRETCRPARPARALPLREMMS